MDNFLFVSRMPDNGFQNFKGPIDGLYLGNEFCHFLIPDAQQIQAGLEYCDAMGIPFALVMPWCSQPALERASAILPLLRKGTEVVFNDWGLMKIIRESGLKPVAGRLLFPHCADPRIAALRKTGDEELVRWLTETPRGIKEYNEILRRNGALRIEFDNTEQGLIGRAARGMNASLYYPYVYITTGRMCLTRYSLSGRFEPGANECSSPCRNILVRRKFISMEKEVFLKGNTQFYINPSLPDNRALAAAGVDRLVFMPDFPF